jgi:hypothetical protein
MHFTKLQYVCPLAVRHYNGDFVPKENDGNVIQDLLEIDGKKMTFVKSFE